MRTEHQKEYDRKYRKEHRKERAAYNKKYNKEHKKEQAAYRKTNKKRIAAQRLEYRNNKAHKAHKKAYDKIYLKVNKERIAAQRLGYRKANREKDKARTAAWRKRNPEKIVTYGKMYGKKHKKKIAVYHKGWCQSSFERFLKSILSNTKREDSKNRRGNNLDIPFVLKSIKNQNELCAGTDVKMEHIRNGLSSASIDRIDPAKGHLKNNSQMVCRFFNLGRGSASNADAKALVKEIRDNTTSHDSVSVDEKALEKLLRKKVVDTRFTDSVRHRKNNIDLSYMLKMFWKQKGRCAATNVPLSLGKSDLRTLSIDRIDNAKGHIRGNVQLVIKFYNLGKSSRPDSEGREFIQKIRAVKTAKK